MRRTLVGVATLATLVLVAGCSQPSDGGGETTELTMWMVGDCSPETCVESALVDAFEEANPGITIDLVPQPVDGYFAALQSASVASTGPDIATMWPGGYMDQFKDYMTDAHDYVDAALIEESSGTDYFAEANDSNNVLYAIPTTNQYYIGFYNKQIFAENGIEDLPRTWDELREASDVLLAAGITPIVNGASGGSAQFQPLYEWSYLASALEPAEWSELYDGRLPYENDVLVSQLSEWAGLYADGYLNRDAFNDPDVEQKFTDGEAAMMLSSGSWSIPELETLMGDDLGVFAPPYQATDRDVLVETAGVGYTVFDFSDHVAEAGEFLSFILSDEGQQVIADMGQPPTRPGFETESSAINQLIALGAEAETVKYPMFDNFTQPAVTDALYKNVGLVLVGELDPAEALAAVDAAFDGLPEEEKDVDVPLGG